MIDKDRMQIHWQTVKLSAVLEHYVKDFKMKSGEYIYSSEYFLDTAKQEIVFKLIIDRTKSVSCCGQ